MGLATLGALGVAVGRLPGAQPAWAYGGRTVRQGRQLPRPVAALVTRWDTDPWSLGSYSALPPGSGPSSRRILREATLGNRITLAGEYASLAAPATTNGALESGTNAADRILRHAQPRRVLVIGAGIAGAAAASRLRSSGAEPIVLEARDRIGGRIYADRAWGAPVELGAAWIHGITGNPVTGLARSAGLGLIPMDWDNSETRDTVTGLPSPAADDADDRLQDLMDQLADAEPSASLSTRRWLGMHGWQPSRLNDWAEAIEITQEYGRDPDALGVRAFSEGDWQRGGDVLVQGGYASIVERLLAGIDVRLNTAVTAVDAGTSGVTARLASGAVVRADAAVVAVPLALLQRGSPRIQPTTSRVRAALGALVTGNLEKVVLRYDEQWWDDLRAIEVVGGGVTGAPPGSQAALRWTEWVSISDLVGFPALVAFSGGSAARTRPSSSQACADEADAAIQAAFAG